MAIAGSLLSVSSTAALHVYPNLFNDPPIGYEGDVLWPRGQMRGWVFDADRGTTYITHETGHSLVELRSEDFEEQRVLEFDRPPHSLIRLHDGDHLVVAMEGPSELVVVEMDTMQVVRTVDLADELGDADVEQLLEVDGGIVLVVPRWAPGTILRVDLAAETAEPWPRLWASVAALVCSRISARAG